VACDVVRGEHQDGGLYVSGHGASHNKEEEAAFWDSHFALCHY